jgi:hypothetical protein
MMGRASADAAIPKRHRAMAQVKSFVCMMLLLLLVRFVVILGFDTSVFIVASFCMRGPIEGIRPSCMVLLLFFRRDR